MGPQEAWVVEVHRRATPEDRAVLMLVEDTRGILAGGLDELDPPGDDGLTWR